MVDRVRVAPAMLAWARRRSDLSVGDLTDRFPKLPEWERGEISPTMRQLENYARATHTPVGFLFLSEPPAEELPIPDFRTFGDEPVHAPTPDLLDTIYTCEQRQDWFREFAESNGREPVALVGSLSIDQDVVEAASQLSDALGFKLADRVEFANWTETLSGLVENAEDAGVLVMISGIVGSNTHRQLDPKEFRGFSLVDAFAPVVFINGADTKAAQIFTLAHELAHIALGGSAISRPDLGKIEESDKTERWCNAVAADLLVPLSSLRIEYQRRGALTEELGRLAKYYKVSTLVVLRRIFDVDLISARDFRLAYEHEYERVTEFLQRRSTGGDYYKSHPIRVSKRFARAIIRDTIEGKTLYGDALRLLGSKKLSTFEGLSQHLGVA